jgi:glycosyltransferase involved in cell wall biosynthesis
MLVAKLRRIPIAISVQDIYPESIVVQGRISENGVIMRALRFLDTLIANSANVLIVISDTFLRLYRDTRGIDASKISVIHNWYDDDSVPSPQGVEQFRADRGIGPSDFLLVFAGNIGAAAGVEQVIDAFAYFDRATSLRLLVAGEGSELARCQQRAAPYGSRIVFETPWHSRDSGKVLHAANLFILPTQGEQSKYSLPSKLLYYMLAGRPVLALATHDSELATIMQQSNCGWVIEPHRPDLFASTVSKLLECSAEELDSRGKSGLQYVTEHFSSRTCLSRLLRLIQELSCG